MGERRTQHYTILIAVIALHLVFVAALITLSRQRKSLSKMADVVTTLIFVPTVSLPKARGVTSNTMVPTGISAPTLLAPSISTPIISTPEEKQAPIDWAAAARQSAVRVTTPRSESQFGALPGQAEVARAPKQHAGDHDRLDTGEHVDWINERCYVISDPWENAGPPDLVMQGMRFLGTSSDSHPQCLPEKDPGTLLEEKIETFPEYKKDAPK
jgi:hypothetical protein